MSLKNRSRAANHLNARWQDLNQYSNERKPKYKKKGVAIFLGLKHETSERFPPCAAKWIEAIFQFSKATIKATCLYFLFQIKAIDLDYTFCKNHQGTFLRDFLYTSKRQP